MGQLSPAKNYEILQKEPKSTDQAPVSEVDQDNEGTMKSSDTDANSVDPNSSSILDDIYCDAKQQEDVADDDVSLGGSKATDGLSTEKLGEESDDQVKDAKMKDENTGDITPARE